MFFEEILALMNSLFILAILSKDIPFGHSTSQAPVLEQFPNPSKSIWFTILRTLLSASTFPCGNNEYCETFAPTNNIA